MGDCNTVKILPLAHHVAVSQEVRLQTFYQAYYFINTPMPLAYT